MVVVGNAVKSKQKAVVNHHDQPHFLTERI